MRCAKKGDQGAKHKVLIDLCSLELIASALAGYPVHQVGIVRCVVLGNIKRGRVTGLMSRENISDKKQWLSEYAQTVAIHLELEREAWRAFATGQNDAELAELLKTFAEKSTTRHEDVCEIWGQAFVVAKDQLKKGYSFDQPIQQWLKGLVRAAAIDCRRSHFYPLAKPTNSDGEEFEDDGEPVFVSGVDRYNPTEEWDHKLDLLNKIKYLKPKQKEILHRKVAGQDAHEISCEMQIPLRTVQNNWTEILKQLEFRRQR